MFDYRRTQMARHDVSAPLRALVDNDRFIGYVDDFTTCLHFGEGKALMDTVYLNKVFRYGLVTPYDPYSDSPVRRDESRLNHWYDVGIAVYVFNVLPPDEREYAYQQFVSCCYRAYFALRTDKIAGEPYKDGVITKHNTFQKSYTVESAEDEFPRASLVHVGSGFIWMVE